VNGLIERFKESLGDHLHQSAFHCSRGVLYGLQGKQEEAAAAFRSGITVSDGSTVCRKYLAYTMEQQSQFREALDLYCSVLESEPFNISYNMAVMRIYSHLKDMTGAKSVLSNFVRRFPGHPQMHRLYTFLANRYYTAGDFAGALSTLEELNQSMPASYPVSHRAELYNNIGILYGQLKQYQKAEISFKTALSIMPSYEAARQNLELIGNLSNKGEIL
jgi:tetratricopeptide (TPR) repeat protein